MASNQPTPLDRMRRYAASLQDAGRSEADFVTVTLGDLTNLVLRLDVLRADLAKQAAEQEHYEDTHVGALNEKNTELVGRSEELEAENTLQREDLEDLQNQNQDLREKLAKAERDLKKEQDLVHSLRLNGARHWFHYAYQKKVDGQFVDICQECEKERDHPSHFNSKASYLDSREVEKAAGAALERVEKLLRSGLGMRLGTAIRTSMELLAGLPGVPTVPPDPEEEQGERYCACGSPESNHPHKHPFSAKPPNTPAEDVR